MKIQRIVLRTLSFLAIGLIPLAAGYLYLMNRGIQPLLSESVSFDDKAFSVHQMDLQHVDVLAMGSSVTLNNVSSEAMHEHLGTAYSYYNASSWGLKMSDLSRAIPAFTDRLEPKVVVLVSARRDFRGPDVGAPDTDELTWYLNGLYPYFYLKNMDIQTLISRHTWREACKVDSTSFFNLRFDEGGGVALHIPDSVGVKRPTNILPDQPTEERHYDALQEICAYLADRGISLLFVETVYKNTHFTGDPRYHQALAAHGRRVRTIVEAHDHQFLNLALGSDAFPDSLHADDIHLNQPGAERLTHTIWEEANFHELLGSQVSQASF